MQRLDARLRALEGPRRSHIDVRSMSTAELEAIAAEAFAGRKPTHDELRELAGSADPKQKATDANA